VEGIGQEAYLPRGGLGWSGVCFRVVSGDVEPDLGEGVDGILPLPRADKAFDLQTDNLKHRQSTISTAHKPKLLICKQAA
jgi:hypothetical protein